MKELCNHMDMEITGSDLKGEKLFIFTDSDEVEALVSLLFKKVRGRGGEGGPYLILWPGDGGLLGKGAY